VSDTLSQVSVIIVTHNSLPALTDCLESLGPAAAGLSFELIVVDNNSSDAGTGIVTERFPDSQIIENQTNRGFAAACNQGAKAASGEFLLFLNPDVQVDPGAVRALVEVAHVTDRAGLVSGRLRNPDGSFQATCRQFPTIQNMIFSRGSVFSRWFGPGRATARYTLPDSPETTEVSAVAATLVLINRELFVTMRGFDERFFMFMEDTDLSFRLYLADYHNLFAPTAGGVHRWGYGSDAGRIRRLRYHHLSIWKYFLRHFPNGFSVLLLPFLLFVNFCLKALFPVRAEDSPV
jgi:GT2 family glycosyltransferase